MTKKMVLLALTAFVTSLLVPTSANATPQSRTEPSAVATLGVQFTVNNGVLDVVCGAYFTPAPQYSRSGGRYGTVHFGGQIICNTAGSLDFALNLYTLVGTGDRERPEFEVQKTLKGAGTSIGKSWYLACLSNTSTRWQANIYARWNDIPFTPYPGWSPVVTLPCS